MILYNIYDITILGESIYTKMFLLYVMSLSSQKSGVMSIQAQDLRMGIGLAYEYETCVWVLYDG
jgi:hypothetical protein